MQGLQLGLQSRGAEGRWYLKGLSPYPMASHADGLLRSLQRPKQNTDLMTQDENLKLNSRKKAASSPTK